MTPTIAVLSCREEAVLDLLASGCGEREIAGRLRLTVFTIRAHKANARHKLNAATTTQAVAIFIAWRSRVG